MHDRLRQLSLVVTATVLLLAGSAVLVVLGIFNGCLHWDLFSPEVEKVLYAVFASCVDAMVLWRYPATNTCSTCGETITMERFFVARDLDRAVQLALSGDTAWVRQMNRDPAFHWYYLIPDAGGKNRAVLEVWGNENESFRDYEAGAKAAAKHAERAR